MADIIAKCKTCGDPFKTSRAGYTVNCPSCRGRKPAKKSSGKYWDIKCSRCGTHYSTLRCPTCGF